VKENTRDSSGTERSGMTKPAAATSAAIRQQPHKPNSSYWIVVDNPCVQTCSINFSVHGPIHVLHVLE
jgi:hypothetical protein